MPRDRKPGPDARRKGRPKILDAAFEEFVKNVQCGHRLEDVAAGAGVTKGIDLSLLRDQGARLSRKWSGNTSLNSFPDLGDDASRLEGIDTSGLRDLIVFVDGRIADSRESRETLRFLIAEGTRFPDLVDRHYDELRAADDRPVSEIIQAGIEAGEFRLAPAHLYRNRIESRSAVEPMGAVVRKP